MSSFFSSKRYWLQFVLTIVVTVTISLLITYIFLQKKHIVLFPQETKKQESDNEGITAQENKKMAFSFPVLGKKIKDFIPNGWVLEYCSWINASPTVILIVQRDTADELLRKRYLLLLESQKESSEPETRYFKVVVATSDLFFQPEDFGRYGDPFVGIFPSPYKDEFDIVFYNGTNWNYGFELTFGQPYAYEMEELNARSGQWVLKRGAGFATQSHDFLDDKPVKKVEISTLKPGTLLSDFNWDMDLTAEKHVIDDRDGPPKELKYLWKLGGM